MKIAVLGCGPAGLLSALAIEQAGHQPIIFSRKQKSVIPGSVYLHESVPNLTGAYPDNHVQYIRLGDAQGYAEKVYGDAARETGWDNYFQVYPSWNAVKAYDKLWEMFQYRIIDCVVDKGLLQEIVLAHDHTITTLPAPDTCCSTHRFKGTPYFIKTLPVPALDGNKDIVVYNGLPDDDWYRWSVLSGICSIESVHPLWLNDPTVTKGIKCTETNCDCWKGVTRAGRWAEWRHGVLLNDAYKTVRDKMREINYG